MDSGSGEEVLRGGVGRQGKIFVSVRVRPLNKNETLNNDSSDWECINDNSIIYKNDNASITERINYPAVYTIDRVFGENCLTREVYEQGAKEVALAVVRGINSSVFAYGQTSSGKTYTMTGITKYSFQDIIKYMEKHTERKFTLKFSAMEIYNESVRDLLSADTSPLRLLDDPERGTVIDKLIEVTIRDQHHLLQLLSICAAQRQIGETNLNENSSRSHQIVRLMVESSARELLGKAKLSTLTGTANFVDLAGSERASQALTAGTRLKEGGYINRSLLTLLTVIRKLSHGRDEHIPYRDSKLTRILQASLGGNSMTAIICTISPARAHAEQSRNTLLFATRAKEVTTSAQVNVVMSDKTLVKHLQVQVARLESELRTPGSTSALLREKELQIEELEKEVKHLILERDTAQSQLKEVLQLLGDDTDSVQQIDMENYPKLRVRSTESPDSPEIDVRPCSGYITSRLDSSNCIQLPNFEDTFVGVRTPPKLVTGSSNYSETDSAAELDESETETESSVIQEGLYKDVHNNEKEDSSSKHAVKSNYLYPEKHVTLPESRGNVRENKVDRKSLLSMTDRDGEIRSPDDNIDKDEVSVSAKQRQERVSASLGEGKTESTITDKQKELSSVHGEDISSRAKFFSQQDVYSSTNMLNKGKAQHNENVEREADVIPTMSEIRESLIRELSPLTFSPRVEMASVGKGTRSLTGRLVDINLEDISDSSSLNEDAGDNDSRQLFKQKPELQFLEEVAKNRADNMTARLSVKSFIDVGLNVKDEYKSLQSWPEEFKRLQKEIIDLWQSCHVSLLHRTYFFLLFKGDPTDAVHMAVESRLLTNLKDTFARGEKTVIKGKKMSLELSKKILRQERRMLSKQMLKKLSDEERDLLFLKWGIGVGTKLRRLQLAHRLWANTEDMNHIYDSAFLVAKLMGFIEKDQTPEETFRLDSTPQSSTTRSYTLKSGLSSPP